MKKFVSVKTSKSRSAEQVTKVPNVTRATLPDNLEHDISVLLDRSPSGDRKVLNWLLGANLYKSEVSSSVSKSTVQRDSEKFAHLEHLASRMMPGDPDIGKMVLLGAVFSCVDPILTVAASMHIAVPIPLFDSQGREYIDELRKIRKGFSGKSKSDHWITVKAIEGFEMALKNGREIEFCEKSFLSFSACMKIIKLKRILSKYLFERNLISSLDYKDERSNFNSNNVQLVRSIVCSGLYPNVAQTKAARLEYASKILTPEFGGVSIHCDSINANETYFQSGFIAYQMIEHMYGVILVETTMVSRFAIIFFGGDLNLVETDSNMILDVGEKFSFLVRNNIKSAVQGLRIELDKIFEMKLIKPAPVDWTCMSDEVFVLSTIMRFLTLE